MFSKDPKSNLIVKVRVHAPQVVNEGVLDESIVMCAARGLLLILLIAIAVD